MARKTSQFPYIAISPQYRQEYNEILKTELDKEEIIVAAVDFAENYFGRHPHFYWGFIIITDHQFIKCYIESETPAAVSYYKIGSRWRHWFNEEQYEDFKWVVPTDVFSDGKQMVNTNRQYQFHYDFGTMVLWADYKLPHKTGPIYLGELRIVTGDDPDYYEYYLTFKDEDFRFIDCLLHEMKVLFAIKTAYGNECLTEEEYSRARKKLWRRMEKELTEHLEWQSYLKSLEEENTKGATENR